LNTKLFPPHKSALPVFFFMLPAQSHHSPTFSIHAIVHIAQSPPTIIWLQSEDYKPRFPACLTSLWNRLRPTLRVHYQSVIIIIGLLHPQALFLDCLLTFLVAYPLLSLKNFIFPESFPPQPSIPSLGWSPPNLTTVVLAVTGGVILATAAD